MTWDSGALTADCVTSIGAENSAEVTEHPVEDGSVIADHVRVNPPTVLFEFSQSKQSLKDDDLKWQQAPINVRESQFRPQGLLALTMAAGAAIGALTNAIGLTSSPGELKTWTLTAKTNKDRIHELHNVLVAVLTKKVSFAYDGLVLSDYLLTAVKYSRDNKLGGCARFQIEAKHVETVKTASSSLVPTGPLAAGGVLRTLPIANKGGQNAESKEKEVVKKSMLASGLDLAGLGML
jgi:hypothetical protein